jgi:DNA-binding NarL/FixJ family response regulator
LLAAGFLVKDTEPENLISAIRVVARGEGTDKRLLRLTRA